MRYARRSGCAAIRLRGIQMSAVAPPFAAPFPPPHLCRPVAAHGPGPHHRRRQPQSPPLTNIVAAARPTELNIVRTLFSVLDQCQRPRDPVQAVASDRAVGCRLSAVGCWLLSAFSLQLSAFSLQPAACSLQLAACSLQGTHKSSRAEGPARRSER
jgi:hypothetical protein